jgi:hypothetical protein
MYFASGVYLRFVFLGSLLSLLPLFALVSFDLRGTFLVRYMGLLNPEEYVRNVRVQNWFDAFREFDYLELMIGKGAGLSSPSQLDSVNYGSMIVESSFVSHIVNYGFVGMALYLAIFLFYFENVLKLQRQDSLEFYVHSLFMSVFVLFSFGNDFHRNMPFSYFFWMMVGFAAASCRQLKHKKPNEIPSGDACFVH